jgi:hypothetical protein
MDAWHGVAWHTCWKLNADVCTCMQVEAMEQEFYGTDDKRQREQQGSAQQPAKKAKKEHGVAEQGLKGKPVWKKQPVHDEGDEDSSEDGAASDEPGSAGADEEQEQAAWQKRGQGQAGPSGAAGKAGPSQAHKQHHQQQPPAKQQQQRPAGGKHEARPQEGEDDEGGAGAGAGQGGRRDKHLSRGQRLAAEAAQRKAEKQAAREEVGGWGERGCRVGVSWGE